MINSFRVYTDIRERHIDVDNINELHAVILKILDKDNKEIGYVLRDNENFLIVNQDDMQKILDKELVVSMYLVENPETGEKELKAVKDSVEYCMIPAVSEESFLDTEAMNELLKKVERYCQRVELVSQGNWAYNFYIIGTYVIMESEYDLPGTDFIDIPYWVNECKLGTHRTKLIVRGGKGLVKCNQFISHSENLVELDLSGLDTSNVLEMSEMFGYLIDLETIKFGNMDTSKVIKAKRMFDLTKKLKTLDLSNQNFDSLVDGEAMFSKLIALEELKLNKSSTMPNLRIMRGMFEHCSSLSHIDMGHLSPKQVCNIANMFVGCNNLISVDMRNIDIIKNARCKFMFPLAAHLKEVIVSPNTRKILKAKEKSVFLDSGYNAKVLVTQRQWRKLGDDGNK